MKLLSWGFTERFNLTNVWKVIISSGNGSVETGNNHYLTYVDPGGLCIIWYLPKINFKLNSRQILLVILNV